MTQLFIRFYFGVIIILITALVIHTYVFQERNARDNAAVIEQALSGGVRTAASKLDEADSAAFNETLAALQSEFEYPVQLVTISESEIQAWAQRRLRDGEVVLYERGSQAFVAGALSDGESALTFGPLPSFVGPSQLDISLGVAGVLLFSAVAIAFLLRPVVQQLRAVERTAEAIAAGDLSARIESKRLAGLTITKAFNAMASRTEGLLNSHRELLQAVSHELRTPLARIRFATDLIGSSRSEHERQEKLAAVDRATEELDELVGELLEYVRMEAHENSDHFEPFNLCDAINEVLETRRPLFPAVDLQVACDPGITIYGDRSALIRAIGNLVSNAGKFANQQVQISVETSDHQTSILVEDDGVGVPEVERERIFNPFVRVENAPCGGAGLGLALVSRIAKNHAAHVHVTDSALGGASFELVLPNDCRSLNT